MPGQGGRLLAGIFLKGLAVLNYLRRVGIAAQIAHLDGEVVEDFENFLALLGVARADNEQRHTRLSRLAATRSLRSGARSGFTFRAVHAPLRRLASRLTNRTKYIVHLVSRQGMPPLHWLTSPRRLHR